MRRITLLFAAMALASLACVGALLVLPTAPARGAPTLPTGFTQSPVVSGLTDPMDMEFAPDGRLFVAEQAGKLRVIRSNGNLATFLDISTKVDSRGERGLTGVAFDPNYSTNRFIYLYYTRKATSTTPVHNRIVRVTAKSSGGGVVAGSEQLLLRLNNGTDFHLGGGIDFGNDGKLYASTGDNGTPAKVQDLTNLFGKMVRINKDGTIPSDNPFYSTAAGNNRAIWALGLRNPFKFAVSRTTSAMFINDVGGNIPEEAWEEINRGVAGANYGWPVHEGVANDPPYVDPIFAYGHGSTDTTGCAITGGTFYEPATVQFPGSYLGDYFFADLCNGWIRSYDTANNTASGFATGLSSVVDLEVSNDGALYLLSRGTPGSVDKITSSGN
jgi:glucose/arabinose dehydrogenase